MKDLINLIFDSLNTERTFTREADEAIARDVLLILKPLKERMQQQTYEEISGMMFEAALAAEKAGFRLGMRFAFQIIVEALSEN